MMEEGRSGQPPMRPGNIRIQTVSNMQIVQKEELGEDLAVGARHYRAFVGPPDKYDLIGALQFSLLTLLGLREEHYLLDVGCGSLRAGRLFIPYLLPGRYYGIEPERWLVEEGIQHEVGADLVRLKRPVFAYREDFALGCFAREFDYLLAQSIFTHASQAQIRCCLAEGARVMRPGALFVATFFEGDDNYAGETWVYPGVGPSGAPALPGRVTYTFAHMQSLAGEQGLRCERIEWSHPAGQTWIGIVHETPGSPTGMPVVSTEHHG